MSWEDVDWHEEFWERVKWFYVFYDAKAIRLVREFEWSDFNEMEKEEWADKYREDLEHEKAERQLLADSYRL